MLTFTPIQEAIITPSPPKRFSLNFLLIIIREEGDRMAIEVFNRCEKKYMLTSTQMKDLKKLMSQHMILDPHCNEHGTYKICNIYYDSVDDRLIRASIEKPVYKEKLRMRSYDTPSGNDQVFVEIKKKYQGIVNKRRTSMSLDHAKAYLDGRLSSRDLIEMEEMVNPQVLEEIDYFKGFYGCIPKLYLSYDRQAFFERDDGDFRVTLDSNIETRRYDLGLDMGSYGKQLLKEDTYLMEIKINKAVPLWFAHILSQLEINPVSFSKYGTEYKNFVLDRVEKNINRNYEGEKICLNQFLQQQQMEPSA